MSHKDDKPSPLHERLTQLQYQVTQCSATEPPFDNPYWNNKERGLYIDVVDGTPLFLSRDKFDSGTGWPSFFRPVEDANLVLVEDVSHGMKRIEVKGKTSNSHLGHVFPDGPRPTGLRYCINSASLKFIPVENLEAEGYGSYLPYFHATQSEVAVFAAGCFWGVEEILRHIPGVLDTEVGYAGGNDTNPTYEKVCTGTTGHAEAVKISFNPDLLSFEKLTEIFFRLHDPTALNRQHNDIGTQYRSAVYYVSANQKKIVEEVIAELNRSGKWKNKIVTEVRPLTAFYPAEEYHQDYLKKNPGGYMCHVLRDEDQEL